MTLLWAAALIVLAYVAGSLPTGYWMGLTKGIDIRTVGSGSTGATNVLRSVGKKEALVVFVVDIAKGYLPVWWAMTLEPSLWSSLGLPPYTIPVAVAVMAVVGHSRSIFLNFTGGKSAATGLGTCLALNPWRQASFSRHGSSSWRSRRSSPWRRLPPPSRYRSSSICADHRRRSSAFPSQAGSMSSSDIAPI